MVDTNKEFAFRLRRVFSQCAVNMGLNINLERYQARVIEDGAGKYLAKGILLLATKEEEVFDFPNNWLISLGRRWHTFKVQYLRWCRRFCPLGITRIWAISKYPDLNVPAQYFGSEYVSFRVIEEKELEAKNG